MCGSKYNYCSTHSGPICFIVECLVESLCSRDNMLASESTAGKLVFLGFARAGERHQHLSERHCSRVLGPKGGKSFAHRNSQAAGIAFCGQGLKCGRNI